MAQQPAVQEFYISSDDEAENNAPAEEDEDEDEQDEIEDVVQELEDLFVSAQQPGDFAAGGALPAEFGFPGIQIEGIPDLISFPLPEFQAKEIIKVATKAPFGRKEETLYDDKVRNSWQLNPSQFKITNPKWQQMMQNLLDEHVKTSLGVMKPISCNLYKMLLYEKGGHFAAHRDTEKEAGMFGTLVIQLPCSYKGGEMKVTHRNRDIEFNFTEPQFHSFYTSFYADCQHEVRQITEGYRICLVYNLIYQGAGTIQIQDQGSVAARFKEIVDEWEADDSVPPMLIYILDHQYTEIGLTAKQLKMNDMAVAEILKKAIAEGQIEGYLAILEKTESGSEEEVYESSLALKHCVTFDDKVFTELSRMNIDEEMVFPKDRYEELEMDEEDIEESTGNEGATVERWYRTAVLVFYPAKTAFKTWINFGVNFVTQKIKTMIAAAQLHSSPELIRRCTTLTAAIIEKQTTHSSEILSIVYSLHNKNLLKLYFSKVQHIHALEPFIQDMHQGIQLFGNEIMKPLIEHSVGKACEHLHIAKRLLQLLENDSTVLKDAVIDAVTKAVVKVINQPFAYHYSVIGLPPVNNTKARYSSDLLDIIYMLKNETLLKEHLSNAGHIYSLGPFIQDMHRGISLFGNDVMKPLIEHLVSDVCEQLSDAKQLLQLLMNDSTIMKSIAINAVTTAVTRTITSTSYNLSEVSSLIIDLYKMKITEPMAAFVARLVTTSSSSNIFQVADEWSRVLDSNTLRGPPVRGLIERAISILERTVAVPISTPKDLKLSVTLPCNCAYCKSAQTYLNDPIQLKHETKANENIRKHVELTIRQATPDVKFETERGRGTPYTLVCTKHRVKYNQDVQQRKALITRLQTYHQLLGTAMPLNIRVTNTAPVTPLIQASGSGIGEPPRKRQRM